jgi:hypothetical protein
MVTKPRIETRIWLVAASAGLAGLLLGYLLRASTQPTPSPVPEATTATATRPTRGVAASLPLKTSRESVSRNRRHTLDGTHAREARTDAAQSQIVQAAERDTFSNGQLAYAALLQRARQLELDALDRLEEQQRQRETEWSRTPAYSDLLRRAEVVDARANARLTELAGRYGLTEEQQLAIFPTLAIATPEYHPALEMDEPAPSATSSAGTAGGLSRSAEPVAGNTVDQSLHDILDEDQQDAFEDDWVDRDRWWTEIVDQLTGDLDEDLAAMADSDDAAGDGEGEDYEDGGNLFDLMQ